MRELWRARSAYADRLSPYRNQRTGGEGTPHFVFKPSIISAHSESTNHSGLISVSTNDILASYWDEEPTD
jgi:hypothetical protein